MKLSLFVLLFLIIVVKSTQKRHRRKVTITSNSSTPNVNASCHDCRTEVEGSEGVIPSVNNASIYFSELVYGWTIEVPLHHDILLNFSWKNEEFLNKTSTCESCKPYIEIIYGFSTSEETFKVDKFYNIRQLTKLSIPSHKAEIRFFSGEQGNEPLKFKDAGFTISFKAISLEQTWSIYTLVSVLIPAVFIILGLAYFCVIMKKKEENTYEVPSLPIPIYVDLGNPDSELNKCKAKQKKENKGRGLRLRTQLGSKLEEPNEITVISSLVESDLSESSFRPEDLVTPHASNPVPIALTAVKKNTFKKRVPPKVNLLNRYSRTAVSTPRYTSFHNEDRHSKSDIVLYEKGDSRCETGPQIFNFDEVLAKGDATEIDMEKSVFLSSSSASSGDGTPYESIRESQFVSPE